MLPTMFNGADIEILCKVSIFLIKIHHAPIVANQTLLPVIRKLEKKLMKYTNELRVSVIRKFLSQYLFKNE